LKFKRGDTYIFFFIFEENIFGFRRILSQFVCCKPILYFRELKICQIIFEESCSVVSSAKRIVKNFNALGRSLTRIRNKIGPNIDPCGTPQEISLIEESTPLIEVNCFLPFK